MKKSERRKDLKEKSAEELRTELQALLKERFGLRMQKATQQLRFHKRLPLRPRAASSRPRSAGW